MEVLETLTASVDKSGKGVYVQASTLGSLEALLEFLRTSKIPVSGINIGPVHKKDITRCAVMLDRAPEFAVVLAFDVPIDKEAEKMADELHIKVFKGEHPEALRSSARSFVVFTLLPLSRHHLPPLRRLHETQCRHTRGEAEGRSCKCCLAMQAQDLEDLLFARSDHCRM